MEGKGKEDSALLVATKRCSMRYFSTSSGAPLGSQWMTPKAQERLVSCTVLDSLNIPAKVRACCHVTCLPC